MYKIATVCVSGVTAVPIDLKPIPRGITGAVVEFLYDDDIWAGLKKKVAFRGSEEVEVICDSDTVIFPAEVAQRKNVRVTVGITGVSADGTVVIPTKWAELGSVQDSAWGNYPAPGEPVPPVWVQVLAMIGDPDNLDTEAKDNLVNAINEVLRLNQETIGGYYTPEVSQPEAGIMQLSFVPSEADLPPLEQVTVLLPEGKQGAPGEPGPEGSTGPRGADGKSAYAYAQDGGYAGTEEEFAKKLASGSGSTYPSVKDYKAKGDGVTDDTAAFQTALAENRVVFVPGGTYKLSGELVIGENCCLELSQDTVLNFTQTEGNCIALGMSSMLKGNHATVFVPYGFSGHAIHASATTAASQTGTPPWSKWDPQWKSGRYLTDLNICKRDTRGFHYSMGDACQGTAVYIESDGASTYAQKFIWGLNFSGLRIAGAFAYGIHGVCKNSGWMHEMRIDAFMDACETGVCLEDCNNVYLSAVVQPRKAYTTEGAYVPYAKQGIRLVRCKNTDLSGSRVWDWDADKTLWTSGGENQHIAMYGDCRGTILNDYLYYWGSADVRDLIYTDTPNNLEAINILQEPFTRWFKPRDNEPYFFNGNGDKRLALKEEVDEYFQTDRVPEFTDALANAIDADGNIYNGVGYKAGVVVGASNGAEGTDSYYWSTGYISCKAGDTLRTVGLFLKNAFAKAGETVAKIVYFNENFERFLSATAKVMNPANAGNGYSTYFQEATLTEEGFEIYMKPTISENGNLAYVRITLMNADVGADPVISINDEIKFSQAGFLADNIKVKGSNVIGSSVASDWNAAEGEPGHVKNRTHYSEYADVVFLDNVTVPNGDETPYDVPLAAGEIYRVVMNGTEYVETAYTVELEGMTGVVVGNGVSVGIEDLNADVPFAIMYFPDFGGAMVYSLTGNESDVFTVTGRLETVHKIPEKYIPDMRPYYVVIAKDGDSYVCADTPAKVKAAYDGGRQLICKEYADSFGGFMFYQLGAFAPNGSVFRFFAQGTTVYLSSVDGETFHVDVSTTT